jgi:predicted RNase H-like nuclease (RuvC/YqgF family)
VEKSISPKISEVHSRYDEDIFAVTGLKKKPDEKTYDFNKRVLADLKAKADKHPELEQEIASLKEKVGKNADAKILADLENVRSEFATFKTAKEKELEDLRKETELSKKRSLIEAEINAFEFDPTIKESVLKVFRETTINALLNGSEFRDGQLVFLDDKGNPLRNQAKNLAAYTANEIVAERMKDVIKQKRIITGPPKPGDPPIQPKSIPDTVKTKVELSDYLLKEGLKRGSKEYDEAYAQMSADLPAGY